MWKQKPSHREVLLWNQCSKQATSLEEQTVTTERTSTTGRVEHYNQECPGCGPGFELSLRRLHFGPACARPETTKLITPSPIPEVVWQQPSETFMDNFKLFSANKIATTVTIPTAHTPEPRHRIYVEVQRLSPKRFLLQKLGTATEKFGEKETRNGVVLSHNNS